MSAEAIDLDAARCGWRSGLAAVCLAEVLDWDFTFLAPMLAAQLLVKMPRPPSLAQGLGMLVVIALTTGGVLLVAAALVGAPLALILALGLLLYLAFYGQLRGAPELVTQMLQTSAVTIPIFAVVSPAAPGPDSRPRCSRRPSSPSSPFGPRMRCSPPSPA